MQRVGFALLAIVGLGLLLPAVAGADEWPQWRGPRRDGVWRETGIIDHFPWKQIPIRWRQPIGSGYAGPTVAQGRVFVFDRVVEPEQQERILCFDAQTGKPLWRVAYPCQYSGISYTAGPRASVTVDQGRAYALGAVGHFHCLDAATGRILWKKDLLLEYEIQLPIWGLAAAPLIYRDLVILQIGGRDACLVAFDKAAGKERWVALSDRASYSAPIVIQQGGRDVLVCWTGDHVAGLDPATGKVFWKIPFPPTRMVIGITTPVVDRNRLFVTSFYDGSLMLALDPDRPAARVLWKKAGPDERHTQALHSIISTPILDGDYIYGVDSYGELRCLDARTGRRIWESLEAVPKVRWGTIHMVRHQDRVWMFNERGELIIARLSPRGYEELSRAKLIEPTREQLRRRGGVCWAHPAYAYRCVFARNDKEIVCADLSRRK